MAASELFVKLGAQIEANRILRKKLYQVEHELESKNKIFKKVKEDASKTISELTRQNEIMDQECRRLCAEIAEVKKMGSAVVKENTKMRKEVGVLRDQFHLIREEMEDILNIPHKSKKSTGSGSCK